MKRVTGIVLSIAVTFAASTAGCAQLLDATLDAAANKTGETVGNAIGDYAGKAIVRHYTPMFTTWYTGFILGMAFHSGNYAVGETEYAIGDYTRWNMDAKDTEQKGPTWMERAYLGTDDDGNQWWKVKFHDGGADETTIMEALFSADRSKLVRLRAKFPNDKEAKEVPVDEGNYYVPPRELSAESLKGATVGVESVSVPAGSFQSRHVQYGSGAGGTLDWWLHDDVPGGLVKYSETYPKDSDEEQPEGSEGLDPDNYVLVLAKYGKGAASELGVK